MIFSTTYPPKFPLPAMGGYRYFFNGQEVDNEVLGEGALHAFEYRMHDTRIGRFWSVDPLAGKFPWNSVYAFAENRVVDGRELEGLEYISVKDSGIDPEQHRNEDGTYSFSLGDYDFSNVPIVSWMGNDYFNIKQHMYNDGNGWNTTGTADQQKTQWVYTNIQNFNRKSMHTYFWGDPAVKGVDGDGKPYNNDCARLAAAQAKTMGSYLMGNVVTTTGALNHNGVQLEKLNYNEAVDYVNRELESGRAVVVGVNYDDRKKTDKLGTDHYIVITGRTTRGGYGVFTFLENAVIDPAKVSNFNQNVLYPQNNTISGHSIWNNHKHEVTRVQKNKQ